MFDEVARVAGNRWGHPEELLAVLCTMVDRLVRVTVQAHSTRRVNLGDPFHYPRPGQATSAPVLRPADLARRMGVGRGVT